MAASLIPEGLSVHGALTEPVNILLVDDQPSRLLTYRTILGDLNENLIDANSGTEVVTMLATEMVRSSFEPSRMPAVMPNRIASGTITAKAIIASSNVLPRRFQMMSLTGILNRVE